MLFRSITLTQQPLKPGENPLKAVQGELLDVVTEIAVGEATEITFHLRGVEVRYDVKTQELSCLDKKATLKPIEGKIQLRILVDRTSVDIFGNSGRLYMPMGVIVAEENHSLEVAVKGGSASLLSLSVYPLRSAWLPKQR